VYRARSVHGYPHADLAAPLPNAFAIYIGAGSADVVVRNVRFDRIPVPGSVVRSLSAVKVEGLLVEDCEFTGDTIGPIVDLVDCEQATVRHCWIHDVLAEDDGSLVLGAQNKPNLTGILADDCDLLIDHLDPRNVALRMDETCHSHGLRVLSSRIERLQMHPSVNAAILAQLGVVDETEQTDGINVQRGLDYTLANNVIVDTAEGIDTFAARGVIRDNVVKLSTLGDGGTGIKLFHGASHNLVTANWLVNRRVAIAIGGSSTSMAGPLGCTGNVVWDNWADGGQKLLRLDAAGAVGARQNLLLRNGNLVLASDYPASQNTTANPELVVLGDFARDGRPDDVAAYYRPSGKLDLYRCAAEPFYGTGGLAQSADALCAGSNACHGYNAAMSHLLAGRFFAQQPAGMRDVEFLFLKLSNGTNRFHRNNGSQPWTQHSFELPSGIGNDKDFAVAADCDGDGDTDVFVFDAGSGSNLLFRNADSAASPGSLQFNRVVNPLLASQLRDESGKPIRAAACGDFNGDGESDLLVYWSSGRTRIWHSFAGTAGQVTPIFGQINNLPGADSIRIADYDGDGRDDVLCVLTGGLRRWYTSNGDGTFAFHAAAY
jgi:hypothetical protein